VGAQAGFYNASGIANSFFGTNAGYFNFGGSYNSFLGYQAGQENRTGTHNLFAGASAGHRNSGGSRNSFLGSQAGIANYNGNDNTFVGYLAGAANAGNDNTFLGSSAGKVNNIGIGNTFVGTSAGASNTDGTANVFVGQLAGRGNTVGWGNTLLGQVTTVGAGALNNASAIGYRAWVTTSNALVLGSINGQNGSTASTNVGIGTAAPAYRLHLNASSAAKVGGGSWVVASDQRLKKDIHDFTDGLNVLLQMKPVTFRYNGKAGIDTDKQFVGVLAQQMQQVAPYTVGQFTYQDSTGKQEQYLDYDPNAITYVLVNAAKELKAENEALRTRNDQLQARLGNLEGQVAQLRQLVLKDSPEPPSAACLYQNQPNPYGEKTVIKYFLPATTAAAQLKVFSATGIEVLHRDLAGKGSGEVELSGREFAAGTYVYQLVVDGRVVDTKKLVLTR
jgi:hypothetical protein